MSFIYHFLCVFFFAFVFLICLVREVLMMKFSSSRCCCCWFCCSGRNGCRVRCCCCFLSCCSLSVLVYQVKTIYSFPFFKYLLINVIVDFSGNRGRSCEGKKQKKENARKTRRSFSSWYLNKINIY